MDIEKTIKSLKRNGYKVSYFETANEVVNYLSSIEGQTIGFGGSRTLQDLNLKEILSKKTQFMTQTTLMTAKISHQLP